jgi:hypothetical protein
VSASEVSTNRSPSGAQPNPNWGISMEEIGAVRGGYFVGLSAIEIMATPFHLQKGNWH